MAVFHNLQALPGFERPVITLGTFDGVHLGHRAILDAVARQAAAISGESILITFEPHPRKVLFPEQDLKILTPLSEKVSLIQAAGIAHVVVAPFTKAFSELSAADYIQHFLVAHFQPAVIVIGHDHHFGHDRKGNIDLLQQYAPEYGYEVRQISKQLIHEAAVSSTKIRQALAGGDVRIANDMLGRPYALKGGVVRGQQLGRTLGFPTANLQPLSEDQLLPANGVYAVRALAGGALQNGMMNIGVRPTVSKELALHLEVHLFDFKDDLYGQEVTVFFVAKLREEQRFNGLDALQAQLKLDALAAKAALSST